MRKFYLLIALLFIFSCDGGPADPPAQPELLPLEVGNRWIFTRTVTNGDGATLLVEPDTVTVIDETVIAGERWFVISRFMLARKQSWRLLRFDPAPWDPGRRRLL